MSDVFTAEEQAHFDAMKTGQAVEPEVVEQEVEAVEEEPAIAPEPQQQQRQKTVPHQALHEERERRKKVEEELRQYRERLAYFEGQRSAQPAPKQEAPALDLPDPEQDPIAAIKRAQDFIRQQAEDRQRQERQQAATRQQQEFIQSVNVDWESFKAQNPDAESAYKHIREARGRELLAMGYSPAQATQVLNGEEFQAMVSARRSGRNIGELVLEIAAARGWQKPQPQAQVKQDGAERARSLSGVGSSPAGPMTAERLAAMGVDEFAAYQEKNPAVVRRLMGG